MIVGKIRSTITGGSVSKFQQKAVEQDPGLKLNICVNLLAQASRQKWYPVV